MTEKHTDPNFYLSKDLTDDLPPFVRSLLKFDVIKDNEKKRCVDDFILKYLTNQKFRNENQDVYILFIGNVYSGIYHSKEDIHEIDFPGNQKLIYKATDNPKRYYLM